MTARISTALRNSLLEYGSVKKTMSNARIKLYTGSQPATADAAPTGTLLCTYTLAGGSNTPEVQATGTQTIAGASGSVNTITVNSIDVLGTAVNFITDLTTTAAAVATMIENNPRNLLYSATSSGAVVTIKARPGLGATVNSLVVGGTSTTLTLTPANMSGGVTAINGLNWGDAASGTLVKNPAETWQGSAVASGTAGWFRVEAGIADSLALDSSAVYHRIDGAVATSGAEWNMGTTTITSGAVQTIATFEIPLPANP